ncbi:polysaccharide pyruvyl transferase family protein [uncultured Parolsenella sp.]|uniref:polysaccharide pyruvyl transferase family protein n=1 Tax=uncultured Parolsenella sp. TaxID=2083008 RepID=UPI002804B106|nr:polysaccharide pyruvyl transferase family protein [uncultured Parolsenella sp.]
MDVKQLGKKVLGGRNPEEPPAWYGRSSEEIIGSLSGIVAQVNGLADSETSRYTELAYRLSQIELELERSKGPALTSLELTSFERYASKHPGKRILVAGWYGADNLGDELMLRAVLEHLPEEALPRTAALLWCNSTYDRLGLDQRIHAIHYPASTWELESITDSFDVLVWGGGAILDDGQFNSDKGNFNTGNLFIRMSEMMLARGKQVYCLGLSSNVSLTKPDYIAHLKNIVEKADHFSLRDNTSLELLASLGIPREKMARCEDLVFSYRELEAPRAHESNDTFTLGFVLLNSPELNEGYASAIAAAANEAKRIHEDKQVKVLLIPFLNDGHFDDVQNADIKAKLATQGIEAELAEFAYSLAGSPICRCDALVSYKYHSALIACCYGIPCMIVARSEHPHYGNKMGYLARLAHAEDALYTSAQVDEGRTAAFAKFLENPPAPSVDKAVFAEAQSYLGAMGKRIAG